MRRRRWIPITIMLVIAAALLASIISISIGEEGPAPPVEGATAAQRVYGGIEQTGNELGSADAPVTISIFNDVQCPECGTWQLQVVPELIERYVRTGEARLVLRHRPIGPTPTTTAAIAATAAGEQGFQWQYVHLLNANVDKERTTGVEDEFLERVADSISAPTFDIDRWRGDYEAPATEARVEADDEVGASLGIAAPSVVVEGPRGTRELTESPPLSAIERAVREAGGG